jgi:tetratricopeptide (TPR) repeat protein
MRAREVGLKIQMCAAILSVPATPVSNERESARETVLTCSRRLRDDAHDADAWHTLGTALAALGDRVGAFAALRNALLLDDCRAHTHLALGNLLFDTARFEEALRCFDCAMARTSHRE